MTTLEDDDGHPGGPGRGPGRPARPDPAEGQLVGPARGHRRPCSPPSCAMPPGRPSSNKDYYVGAALHRDLISPFYSPCLTGSCVPGSHPGTSSPGGPISPALLILIFPLGFRLTCYYYRKAYYRSFWRSPPACAVADAHGSYSGSPLPAPPPEHPPLLLLRRPRVQRDPHHRRRRGLPASPGRASASAWAPSSWPSTPPSCGCTRSAATACRHLCGGGVKQFSKSPIRHRIWKALTPLNARHMLFAWMSLVFVALTDLYVRLVASGTIHDPASTSRGTRGHGRVRDPRLRRHRHRRRRRRAPGRHRGQVEGACAPRWCASRCWARPTRSWPRAAWPPPSGNVYSEDNWQVHFRDTMRGGKMLNNWRMAQLHAQEAPDRVRELEDWGALFDRTKDGLILQRDFGGHRFARLAHVGDRTGLELIRTLQQKAVADGIEVFMELQGPPTAARTPTARSRALVGYWRPSGRVRGLQGQGGGAGHRRASARAGCTPRTPGSRPETATPWPCGPGPTSSTWSAVQFHPTGMVWPLSVRGILVTEGVRGDGGVLRNSEGKRFMFDYIPRCSRPRRPTPRRRRDRWYDDHSAGRRPPELLPRDEVARSINTEVKAGRGSPHGGVFLDIATRRSPEYIRRRLPSMYHQFKELAGVDITAEAMEVGPTCHYVMGGVRVEADIGGGHRRRACSPRARSPAACTAPTGWVGTRCRTSWSSAGGPGWAQPSTPLGGAGTPSVDEAEVDEAIDAAQAPFDREAGENPYDVHHDLQGTMQSLVGIIRTDAELKEALGKLEELEERAANIGIERWPALQPGLEPGHRPTGHADRVPHGGPGGARIARRAGAATPGTTTRCPTRSWARSTSSSASPPTPRVTAGPAASRRFAASPSTRALPVMPDELAALRGGLMAARHRHETTRPLTSRAT